MGNSRLEGVNFQQPCAMARTPSSKEALVAICKKTGVSCRVVEAMNNLSLLPIEDSGCAVGGNLAARGWTHVRTMDQGGITVPFVSKPGVIDAR